MLKSGICILLVFHEKMIVLYKLNFFFTKKLHRERTEGNKNTKAVLFMKERRNFYSVSIRECSFPIFNRGRKIVLIWFGNTPNNNKYFQSELQRPHFSMHKWSTRNDSMKIYLVFIRVHTRSQKRRLSELVWSPP